MKVINYNDLKNIIDKIEDNKSVVFSSGVFDLFHYGHFMALKKASMLGDIFIVQIDGNELVKKRKGNNRPFLDEKSRAEIISSLNFIDYVFISNLPSENPNTLKIIKPDRFIRPIRVNESDLDRINIEKQINEKSLNTKVVWLEQTPEISTTKLSPFASSIIMNSEANRLFGISKYILRILRNLTLLIFSPKDFLYSFTYSNKTNIEFKNNIEASTGVLNELSKEITKIIPDFKFYLVGSSALGIVGEKDLDVVVLVNEVMLSKYIKKLSYVLGKPKNISSNEIEWSNEIKGYNVDFALINSKSKILNKRVQITNLIKSNKLLWNKYLELKLNSIGINEREYDRRKMWFFKTLKYRLKLYERKLNTV